MKIYKNFSKKVVSILKDGGVGVIPTDTIYGIVGLASKRETVSRIYKLRHRNPIKPMIILISSLHDLRKFDVDLSAEDKKIMEKVWPGKVSIILNLKKEGAARFKYLHRGKKKLAFRLPNFLKLRQLLYKTGPLVAPSANLEGLPPAKNIAEAQKYFGDRVDFYVDGGFQQSLPSALIEVKSGKVKVWRAGEVELNF